MAVVPPRKRFFSQQKKEPLILFLGGIPRGETIFVMNVCVSNMRSVLVICMFKDVLQEKKYESQGRH